MRWMSCRRVDERLARESWEMRYFAGMTESEVASAMGVTERTVRRALAEGTASSSPSL